MDKDIVNTVSVTIDGEVFQLSSTDSEEHIKEVAFYIDKKIREIYSVKSKGSTNSRLRTLFISLNIANDLFKEIKEKEEIIEEMSMIEAESNLYKDEMKELTDINNKLKERIKELEEEVKYAENQLNEYIEVFEINEGIRNNKVKRLN